MGARRVRTTASSILKRACKVLSKNRTRKRKFGRGYVTSVSMLLILQPKHYNVLAL
jgi:hypothetical protein